MKRIRPSPVWACRASDRRASVAPGDSWDVRESGSSAEPAAPVVDLAAALGAGPRSAPPAPLTSRSPAGDGVE
jgi:hypothetical protein